MDELEDFWSHQQQMENFQQIDLMSDRLQLTFGQVYGGRVQKYCASLCHLLGKTCVVEGGVSNNEFQNFIDVLGKLAGRPWSPGALQQLLENAKNASASSKAQGSSTNKEDKGRLSKEKKIPTSRMVGVTKDDTKTTSHDGASADPHGLHEKVDGLFEDWIQICDGPASNDKAYAVYVSTLALMNAQGRR